MTACHAPIENTPSVVRSWLWAAHEPHEKTRIREHDAYCSTACEVPSPSCRLAPSHCDDNFSQTSTVNVRTHLSSSSRYTLTSIALSKKYHNSQLPPPDVDRRHPGGPSHEVGADLKFTDDQIIRNLVGPFLVTSFLFHSSRRFEKAAAIARDKFDHRDALHLQKLSARYFISRSLRKIYEYTSLLKLNFSMNSALDIMCSALWI